MPSPLHEVAKDQPEETHRVVVLLGSGRSGTSLATKILAQLGMRLDNTLRRANEMNPDGYFEDLTIIEGNQALLEALSLAPPHVPPLFAPNPPPPAVMAKLRAHLKERVQADPSLWGFKDPRTSRLLPLYRRMFQGLGIVPIFVFCARDGASVVESLMRVTSLSRTAAEQVYLTRCLSALRDCGANCHVLHYERLLNDPEGQIARLADYVWPEGAPVALDAEARRALVNPALNRSAMTAIPLTNPLARRIDALIASMDGSSFDHDAVTAELREIDQINQGYMTWLEMIAAREKKPGQAAAAPAENLYYESGKLFEGLGTSIRGLLAQNDALTRQVQAEGRTVARLTADLDTAQADLAEARARLESEAGAEAGRTAALKAANAALAGQLAEVQGRASRQRDDYAAAVERARGRLNEIAERDATLTRLKADLAKARARVNQLAERDTASAGLEADLAKTRAQLAQLADCKAANTRLEAELARMRGRLDDQQAQLEKQKSAALTQKERADRLRTNLDNRNARLLAEQRRTAEIMNSRRFRAGTALVEAVRRPGWNTLALPWRLIKAAQRPPEAGE